MNLNQFSLHFRNRSKALEIVLEASRKLLQRPEAEETRKYIQDRISPENQDKFDFGYFPSDEHLNLLIEEVGEERLRSLGLLYDYHVQNDDCRVYIKKSPLESHNMITPYRDVYGNILAFVGRTTLSETDRKNKLLEKYKYSRFSRSLYLYGLFQAKSDILKQGSVVLVEGQIDCITCHEYGINNAVSLGGVAFTKYQFDILRRYTDTFYLLLDNDAEGEKAQNKIIKKYSEHARIEKVRLPGSYYKDIDEYLRKSNDRQFSKQIGCQGF